MTITAAAVRRVRPRNDAGLAPSEAAVLAIAVDAVVRVLEAEPAAVGMSTLLAEDLGADSLALVEIIEIVEFRVRTVAGPAFAFADQDLAGLTSVGAVVRYVIARTRG